MKRIFCVISAAFIICAMCSCSSDNSADAVLPKGHASYIYYSNGADKDVDFEYVTETTVKITHSNGTYSYVPLSQIESIVVKSETDSSKSEK